MDRVTQVVVAVVVMAVVAFSAHAQDAKSVPEVESRIDPLFSRFDSPRSPGPCPAETDTRADLL